MGDLKSPAPYVFSSSSFPNKRFGDFVIVLGFLSTLGFALRSILFSIPQLPQKKSTIKTVQIVLGQIQKLLFLSLLDL